MEDIHKELECAICCSVMADPRQLSCNHSFCLRCLHAASEQTVQDVNKLVMKCPYNCGETTVSDVRGLRRHPIVTNLCFNLRRRNFTTLNSSSIDMCDYCCRDISQPDLLMCNKCSAFLCRRCVSDPTHEFLCNVQQKFYPFFYGWQAAEAELVKKLATGSVHNARIHKVARLFVPCNLLTVSCTVKADSATTIASEGSTSLTQRVLVFAANNDKAGNPKGILPRFARRIEQKGFVPSTCKQLSTSYKVQEIQARQLAILQAVRDLLTRKETAAMLLKNSESIADPLFWDGGLANDCAVLADMQLTLVKQLYVPIKKKIQVLEALEGFKTSGNVTSHKSDHWTRHLQLVHRLESFSNRQNAEEQALIDELDDFVQNLLRKQHKAYEKWKEQKPRDGEAAVLHDGVRPTGRQEHEDMLTVLGFCHKVQLEIVDALEIVYQDTSTAAAMGGEAREPTIAKEKRELLNMIRNVQQVRIFHRQYFYCAAYGRTVSTRENTRPFPVTVPRPAERNSTLSLPNLLQTLQPKLHEFREDGNRRQKEQIEKVLVQTLELLHREQILQLREGVQEARDQLMLYVEPGSVTALLEQVTPRLDSLDVGASCTDVHDLQCIQMLWVKAFESAKGEADDRDALEQTLARKYTELSRLTEDRAAEPNPPLDGENPGDVLVADETDAPRGYLSHPSRRRSGGFAGQLKQAQGRHRVPPAGAQAAEGEPDACGGSANFGGDFFFRREQGLQLGDRLTRGVVDSLGKYMRTVTCQRDLLQECMKPVPEAAGRGRETVRVNREKMIGEAADSLELHLKVVENLRMLLKAVQGCRSATRKFQLLAQVITILHRLQALKDGLGPDSVKDVPEADMLVAIAAMQDLQNAVKDNSSVLSLPPAHPSEPLLSWIAKQSSFTSLGLMEWCFPEAPNYWHVAESPFTPDTAQKKVSVERASNLSGRAAFVKSIVAAFFLTAASSVSVKHDVPSYELDVASHVPLYKGEYLCDNHKEPLSFVVNGQTGDVQLDFPPQTCFQLSCSSINWIMRSPTVWLIANGAVLYALRRRAS
ncbi:hypothetical protein DIPPA_01686 [Diplonema papillatum]|nr:hypothetical protein DIPPA_01686 [Diplonema papillatum]